MVTTAAGTASPAATEQTPFWKLDLASVGAEPSRSTPASQIAFVDDQLLIATFWTKDATGWQLHAVSVDTRTGKVKAKQQWPQEGTLHFQLRAGSHGRFVIGVGSGSPQKNHFTVSLFGPDLNVVREIQVATKGVGIPLWRMACSPSGDSLFLETTDFRSSGVPGVSQTEIDVTAYRTDNLSERAHWAESMGSSVSDSVLVQAESVLSPGFGRTGRILLSPSEKPDWRPIYRDKQAGEPTMLDDQTLALSGYSVAVLTTRGEVLFQDREFARNELTGFPAIPSADGHRFAIVTSIVKRPTWLSDYFVDTPSRLIVYDVPAHSRVLTLDLAKHPVRWEMSQPSQAIALSRDGLTLALAHGTVVEAYLLPTR